jgi:protein involved in polysaccharide export with SLBB domain
MLYEHIKKKNVALYENVISTSNSQNPSFAKTDRLFVPYTDIEWNKLKIQQQQRNFNIFTVDKTNASQLFLD